MWSTKHKMQGQKIANKPSTPHHQSKSNMALGKAEMCLVVVGATFSPISQSLAFTLRKRMVYHSQPHQSL
jgi:hypothetical protein